jgi:hypothetical protein
VQVSASGHPEAAVYLWKEMRDMSFQLFVTLFCTKLQAGSAGLTLLSEAASVSKLNAILYLGTMPALLPNRRSEQHRIFGQQVCAAGSDVHQGLSVGAVSGVHGISSWHLHISSEYVKQ